MMIGGLSALILLGTICQTVEVPHRVSTTVAKLGENVTLECPASNQGSNVYIWYKMTLGNMPQTVATVTYDQITISEQRFTVARQKDHYVLTIQNVNKDDEGTYLCQSGISYSQTFTNGTFVTIKEARVHCPGEHNVYWFEAGSGESHPSTIYTHVRNGDKPEEKSCVYNLSRSRDCSDSGTYYCAVVTCGEILSGEETTQDTSTRNVHESDSNLDPVVLVLGALLFCCVIVIVVLSYFIKRQKLCDRHEGEMRASLPPGRHKTTVDQPSDLDNDAAALNYAALNFTTRKLKKQEKKRKLPEECVYSVVRADYHNNQQPSLHIDQDL